MNFTRRGFLAGTAAAAATPAVVPSGLRPALSSSSFGPGPVEFELRINGENRKVEAEPRATLLEVLRWQLGFSGPKEVCDRAACGACTVLLDDRPVCACMTLALDAAGHEITTIEGLGTPEAPGRVQAAFLKHDAVQCGYCIPGMATAMEGVLRRNPKAGEEELRAGIAGNLCRCGTYTKIFEAAARLTGKNPPAGLPERNAPACIESEHGRVDAAVKIAGTAVYGADVARPGMLFARHVLCPYGKAKLVSADLETVRKLPGVVDVEIGSGKIYPYSGAPVGHVCAESPAALRDGITALNLVWERERVETDPLRLHQEQHGAFPPEIDKLSEGKRAQAEKVEAALRGAPVVLERTYTTQIQNHNSLESHGAMVDPGPDPSEAWMSTQGTFSCLGGITKGLECSRDEVAVKCDYVGGGFGSKFGAGREGLLAATLARKFSRPVRVFNDRESEQLDTGNRPGSLQWMKVGVDADGKIAGAIVYVAGIVGVGGGGGASNPSRYDFGKVLKLQNSIRGYHGAPRAFRAPGHPQGMFAVESMMDELAEAAGRDPVAFRLLNETSDVRRKMLQAGVKEIGWARRRPTGSQTGRLRRGFGVGACDWHNGPSRCEIRMTARSDGTVHVYSGTQDIGTGQRTVLTDLAADSLGLDRARVVVHMADSRFPYGPASGGSTTARATAPAVRDTAAKLQGRVESVAGLRPLRPADWKEAFGKLPAGGVTVEGKFNRKYFGTGGSEGVQFAEVVVDAETGVIRVEHVVALQSCGLAVNRLGAENQVIGAVIQGVSYALFEERATDPQFGNQLNADLELYKIAGALDVPRITPILWGRKGGLGVRSLGEPPTIPTSGAIANAVANALGVRVRSLPLTPDKVLEALEEQA